MNDMIKKLVDIDDYAKLYEKETKRLAERLSRETDTQAEAVYEKYMADARLQVEKDCEYIRKNAEQSFIENEKRRNAVLKMLDEQFNQNHNKWVNDIVERVLA